MEPIKLRNLLVLKLRKSVLSHLAAIIITQLGLLVLCWCAYAHERPYELRVPHWFSETTAGLTLAALCSQLAALAYHAHFLYGIEKSSWSFFLVAGFLSLIGGFEATLMPSPLNMLEVFVNTTAGIFVGAIGFWLSFKLLGCRFTLETPQGILLRDDVHVWYAFPRFSIRGLLILAAIVAFYCLLLRFRHFAALEMRTETPLGDTSRVGSFGFDFLTFLAQMFLTTVAIGILFTLFWVVMLSRYRDVVSSLSAIMTAVMFWLSSPFWVGFFPISLYWGTPLLIALFWHLGVTLLVFGKREIRISRRESMGM